MAGIVDVMRDAVGALDYAVDALEAPSGASIRDTARELKDARGVVADMLAALKRAEMFISGFEDDETQDGVNDLLVAMRAVLNRTQGEA